MTDPILEEYREEILRVATKHGATQVRVFGSRARDESGEGSDLDLLISLEKGRSLLDLVRLKRELEELTHHDVDVVTERSLSPFLRERVLAEAVRL